VWQRVLARAGVAGSRVAGVVDAGAAHTEHDCACARAGTCAPSSSHPRHTTALRNFDELSPPISRQQRHGGLTGVYGWPHTRHTGHHVSRGTGACSLPACTRPGPFEVPPRPESLHTPLYSRRDTGTAADEVITDHPHQAAGRTRELRDWVPGRLGWTLRHPVS
jgi:hypothetical protein